MPAKYIYSEIKIHKVFYSSNGYKLRNSILFRNIISEFLTKVRFDLQKASRSSFQLLAIIINQMQPLNSTPTPVRCTNFEKRELSDILPFLIAENNYLKPLVRHSPKTIQSHRKQKHCKKT